MSDPNSTANTTPNPFSAPGWPRLFFILLASVAFAGCAYYPTQSSGLPMGASKAQIQNMIGSPKSSSRDGSVTTWNYGGGTVCVFKDDQLVASNFSRPAQSSQMFSLGSLLPPVSFNFAPAPYYPARVFAAPVCYGSWNRPFFGGWGGYGWGGGYGRPYWSGNNWGSGFYRRNWNNGNWNRGNSYNRGYCR